MKTSEISRAALNYAVSLANGQQPKLSRINTGEPPIYVLRDRDGLTPAYSTDWSQGGPIIEREGISVCYDIELSQDESRSHWATIYAVDSGEGRIYGPTPLIAAMRCYVASKLGDNIEIPKELI